MSKEIAFDMSGVSRDELIELLAAQEHARWSRWEKWRETALSPESITRWRRQRETDYTDLSEEEKESDRKEARLTIELLHEHGVTNDKRSWAELVVVAVTDELARQGCQFPEIGGEGLEPEDFVRLLRELEHDREKGKP